VKLTWFGGSTFRIQIGGQVVVMDAQNAPERIDRGELVSGADRVVAAGEGVVPVDAGLWRPRPAERLLDAGDTLRQVEVWSVGASGLLIDGDDDRPLLLAAGDLPELGRWIDKAVVVLIGGRLADRADGLLAAASPALVALAGPEAEIDTAFERVRSRLDGTGLVALEPGLAVEA
jgi:hypothetical protein